MTTVERVGPDGTRYLLLDNGKDKCKIPLRTLNKIISGEIDIYAFPSLMEFIPTILTEWRKAYSSNKEDSE